ncbi:ribonuclease HI [Thiomicrorhabdus sp. 6S2-11]|uniref:ribonuclease H n=1 Tax=Thiomicrorhabdus marina TaxID=2818442 RepID=A0ABS3Q3C2_9GAMM|nr:ribonuclease H [Thiomicrorhabdus marina]MBO1926835.1 ribonuclease HI [Thiomicrorhabdus marina]
MDFRQHTPYQLPQSPTSETPPLLHLYTDGAYFKQYHLGGWAVAIYDSEKKLIETLSGSQLSHSSLEMELTAAIKALEWLQQNHANTSVALYTDAQILLEGLLEKYPKWQKNNWRSSNGNPVVFSELWQEFHRISITQSIDFYWTKGHANDSKNQLADQLAREKILNTQTSVS